LKRREEVWKRINLWDSCIVCPHVVSLHLLATLRQIQKMMSK
jgi:hypothetical protein